jgi:hypothetical protein
MKTTKLSRLSPTPSRPPVLRSAYIMDGETGNMIHSTVPPGQ